MSPCGLGLWLINNSFSQLVFALCCLLFREHEASQSTLPGHCFGMEMPVPDLALLSYLPVTCQGRDHPVLLPPSTSAISSAVFGPHKCSKTDFFFLLFLRCCCAALLYTLLKHFAPESSTAKRPQFFPPRTIYARDTESQIPQIWGLCQLSLQADRGSCCRSTFSNCYFISICFIASQCQGLFLAMTSH